MIQSSFAENRSVFFRVVSDDKAWEIRQAAGAKDMAQRVHERVGDLVESHEASPLPDEMLSALEQLKRRGEAELTAH